MTTIEVYNDEGREFRWRFVAANGRIMADSAEGYVKRSGAKRAARRFLQLLGGPVEVVDLF